jgi:hypothetical protein
MSRVGQNRMCTPYMTVYLMTSLPKIPYVHRTDMVLTNPINECKGLPTLQMSAKFQTGHRSAEVNKCHYYYSWECIVVDGTPATHTHTHKLSFRLLQKK